MPGCPLWARPAVSPEGSHPIPTTLCFWRGLHLPDRTLPSPPAQCGLPFRVHCSRFLGDLSGKEAEPKLGQSGPVSVPLHCLLAGRLPPGPTAPLDLTHEGVRLIDGQTPFRVQVA